MLANVIVSIVLLLIVGYVSYYIYKEKKKGRRCIGCSAANSCTKTACVSLNKETIDKIKEDIIKEKKEQL